MLIKICLKMKNKLNFLKKNFEKYPYLNLKNEEIMFTCIGRNTWKWKNIFYKSFTHYLQMQGKNVLLTSITKANVLQLSQHAYTTHV
jgi:hypothetical protein